MDYNCELTWNLFKEGKTKGIFQLESNLGRSWAKKLEPSSLKELAALISLVRPGVLKAMTNGKSMAQHYVDRKHGRDEVTYIHDSLKDILDETHGVIVYQEQCMKIANKLAGFNLQEADELRKAIGKKNAALMAKVRDKFIAGCGKTGIVSTEIGAEIFSWIHKSARYLFNKSHAVTYAMDAYWSAYDKAHNTKDFFLSCLTFAHDKQDSSAEIYDLISEAKLFDITARVPKINMFKEHFNLDDKGIIHFGIKDVKSLTGVNGDKVAIKIKEAEELLKKPAGEFSWMEILVYLSREVNSTTFKALASIGFFSTPKTDISRNKALYEYAIFSQLTKVELGWVRANFVTKKWSSLIDCFRELVPTKKNGGGTSSETRSQVIRNEIHFLETPPYSLEDNPSWIIDQEVKYLGCPVSLAKVESVDTSSSNTSCKEIADGRTGENLCLVGNISRATTCKVKKGKTAGQTMAFLTIEDETCSLDSVVIFPSQFREFEMLLYEGNNLLFCGTVTEKDGSFIVNKIHEI